MRSLGQFTDIRHVAIFRDYLEAIDIPCRLDEYQGKAQLWVFDEDDLPRAHKELVEFLAHPETAKYQNSAEIAAKKRNLELAATLKEHRALSRRGASSIQKDFGRIWRSMPLTVILIALCVVVTIITSFGFDRVLTNHFRISQILAHNQVWTYPLKEVVFDWEVWRLFTPVFIHMSPLHLLMNMYWLAMFGGVIERLRGTTRLLLMTLVIGCVSNYLQYRLGGVSLSQPNPQFGGISGVVFGFFGYLWFLTYFDRRQGVALQPSDSMWFFFWMLLCMTGLIGDVANVAHVSGLVVGLMLAGLGKLVRQLLGK